MNEPTFAAEARRMEMISRTQEVILYNANPVSQTRLPNTRLQIRPSILRLSPLQRAGHGTAIVFSCRIVGLSK
jgi:hypothetical protein